MITSLKELTEADLQARRLKNPSMPEYALAKTKFSDKKANDLTKAILAWFNLSGGFAERISVTGRLIDNRKTYRDSVGKIRQIGTCKWIKSSMTKGSGDISATYLGKSFKIEVKIGKDRQSDDQKEYEESVVRAGGVYIIASSFEGFINQMIVYVP